MTLKSLISGWVLWAKLYRDGIGPKRVEKFESSPPLSLNKRNNHGNKRWIGGYPQSCKVCEWYPTLILGDRGRRRVRNHMDVGQGLRSQGSLLTVPWSYICHLIFSYYEFYTLNLSFILSSRASLIMMEAKWIWGVWLGFLSPVFGFINRKRKSSVFGFISWKHL